MQQPLFLNFRLDGILFDSDKVILRQSFAVSGAKQHIVKRSDMIFAVTGLYLQEDIIFAVLIQILAIFIHGDEPPCFHRL